MPLKSISQTTDSQQTKVQFLQMQWNAENIVMFKIKHLQIYQISVLNKP